MPSYAWFVHFSNTLTTSNTSWLEVTFYCKGNVNFNKFQTRRYLHRLRIDQRYITTGANHLLLLSSLVDCFLSCKWCLMLINSVDQDNLGTFIWVSARGYTFHICHRFLADIRYEEGKGELFLQIQCSLQEFKKRYRICGEEYRIKEREK